MQLLHDREKLQCTGVSDDPNCLCKSEIVVDAAILALS